MIGASIGQIGTAVGQQSLRAVLGFCNARQMTAPEAYITFSPEIFPGGGECANESTRDFLKNYYMAEFRDHVVRVLTVPASPTVVIGSRHPSRQARQWRPTATWQGEGRRYRQER